MIAIESNLENMSEKLPIKCKVCVMPSISRLQQLYLIWANDVEFRTFFSRSDNHQFIEMPHLRCVVDFVNVKLWSQLIKKDKTFLTSKLLGKHWQFNSKTYRKTTSNEI